MILTVIAPVREGIAERSVDGLVPDIDALKINTSLDHSPLPPVYLCPAQGEDLQQLPPEASIVTMYKIWQPAERYGPEAFSAIIRIS